MKIMRFIIFAIYFIVYAYACNKTSTNPQDLIWGYVCALVFLIVFSWLALIFSDSFEKKD